MNKEHPLLSWQLMVLKLALFGLVAVFLQQPAGSVKGRIALELPGFHVHSYDITGNNVYALATGTGAVEQIERGVWVNGDGTFEINQLPKGEYSLVIRAPGFDDLYKYGIFVNDGQAAQLGNSLVLEAQRPSVRIGSNARVFTTKESPHFWLSTSGADQATVNIYRFNALDLIAKGPTGQAVVSSKDSDNDPISSNDIQALKLNASSDLSIYKPYGAKSPLAMLKERPLATYDRELTHEGNWARPDFKLEKPLPAGDYLVTAEVQNTQQGKDWNIFWFNVSDLGLIVKNDGKRVVARAIDLNTLKPKQNATVEICARDLTQQRVKLKGKTAKDGFAEIPIPAAAIAVQGYNSVVIGRLGDSHAYGGMWAGSKDNERYKTFCYTERPVYRLGQTVFFKTIVRTNENNALKNPGAGLAVAVSVSDPDSNSIFQKNFKTNDHGTFAGTVELPADGKTGAYQISITYPDKTTYTQAFEIAEYRKPEYEVTVTPLSPQVVAGERAKAKIKAHYYFGAPVANAKVKYSIYASSDYQARYRLMPRPAYMSYYDGWEDENANPSSDDSYGGDYLSEGTAQTDQNGEAVIEFDTKRPVLNWETPGGGSDYTDQIYKVQVEVTDLSRMSVIGSGTCSVVIGDFEMFLSDDAYVLKSGDAATSHLTALTRDGKPVANQKVTVALCRWPYDSVKNEQRERQIVSQQDIVTDADGKALVKFDTEKSLATDTYYITALSKDAGGREIFADNSFWLANDSSPYFYFGAQAEKQALSIKLDKKVYKLGDTAKAIVTAPVTGKEGFDAIVSIEANSLIRYWTIPLDASVKFIDVPIVSSFEPNVYLSVTYVSSGHQFHHQSQSIKVAPENHYLNLAIKADREKYRPGETADFTVKATLPNGTPAAKAEVSLGLVDESIYAIRPDNTEDMVKSFYPKRSDLVETICTFPETYSGGPDKIEPRVRKDFRDTAKWLPNLTTDEKGIVVAHIKLPDNLTTWRATVRGCTLGDNFGSVVGKIVSNQDLIVRLALPRFFTVGDEGFVSALVQNYTDRKQTVKLSLSLSKGIQTTDRLNQQITVEPNVTARYSWPAKIVEPGEATLSIKAVGQTAGDAMETKLPIVALGIPAFSAKSGVLTGDPETVTIPWMKADCVPGTARYKLSLAPTSIGPVLGNFDALIDYPYGCTEQTMSRLMPSVVALTLHKELGLPISKKMSNLFDQVYKKGMDKLESYQHDDGGWGWWQTDESNLYLTALVLEGFKQLEKVDYEVDADKQKSGLEWLKKGSTDLCSQLVKPMTTVDAYELNEHCIDLANACYVIALYGEKPDPSVVDYLSKRITTLSPEALAYLALAEKLAGSPQVSEEAYKQLLYLANRSGDIVDWEPTKELIKRMKFKAHYGYYSYRFTGVETTALALRAVLAMEPKNSVLIESVKNWLLSQRNKDGWDNTKTTAQVFLVLLEEQLAYAKGGAVQIPSIRLSDGGRLLEQMNWAIGSLYGPEKTVNVPIQSDSKSLTLSKEGPGRVFYSSLLTYQHLLKPGENVDAMSMPEGLRLERTFSRVSVAATTSDGKIHFHATNLTQNTVHAGETILMKVKLTSPTSVPYVMIECALPSGAEVVAGDTKANNLEEGQGEGANADDDSPFQSDWRPPWWTHQDILDDRIVFFVTDLPAGTSEFPVMVRMEMPGTFEINPLKLEGMYTEKVRGYSAPGVMKVVE